MRGNLEEIKDVLPGLWLWRVQNPDWNENEDWEPLVTSTCVESDGQIVLIDPIAPSDGATEFWDRLDAHPPTILVVINPAHIRDVDLFARRYDARSFGPFLFWKDDIPETNLEPIEPGNKLPGGLIAQYDGRGRNETPLWLPKQRTLVFADALTEREGALRIWASPHEERALSELRELLKLPFGHVIVSHGEPVHDRKAYEQALTLPPWVGQMSW